MSFNKAKRTAAPFPVGNFPARLKAIIEIGVQPAFEKNGKTIGDQRDKVILTYEFPTVRIDHKGEDHARVLSTPPVSYSLHEKATLGQMARALVRNFKQDAVTPEDLINKPCMVVVDYNKKGDNVNIKSVTPPVTGLNVDELETPGYYFDFDNPDEEVFKQIPEWLVKRYFTRAVNYKDSAVQKLVDKHYPDADNGGGDESKLSAKDLD